jgi:copper ion binding protein
MITLRISGMSCAHCVKAVTKALEAVPGVKEVQVDLEGGQAKVTGDDQVSEAALKAAVEDAGYSVG